MPNKLKDLMTRWLSLIGPGAIVASLTIGAGELVFSSRGGALFGYHLLAYFLLICLLKWALVFMAARHIVLTGSHPAQRWCALPGPRGWLVWVFMVLAVIAFPIWVGFHAGTIGTLLDSLLSELGVPSATSYGSHIIYGLVVLVLVMLLVRTGNYQRLERVQVAIVSVMLGCVLLSLFFLSPNWSEVIRGMFAFHNLEYPSWVASNYPEIAKRPIWMELATYVGVLGGSGYDYLAYVSFLRDKGWGAASESTLGRTEREQLARDHSHANQKWVWVSFVDTTISFAIVFFFSAVFVICGTLVLRPQQQIPDGTDLLTLQAKFVEAGSTWLRPMYFLGAFLAMFGTLYGTIEVAPTVAREFARALFSKEFAPQQLHRWVTNWVGMGGVVVLLWTFASIWWFGNAKPKGLIALLDPANLFTGVLACGWITCLSCWSEFRFLPRSMRAPGLLIAINIVGCMVFTLLGIKAYWDYGGIGALAILMATIVAGWIAAWCYVRFVQP
jgi:Mn2+/Fe2+ NRAMP family transporter